MGAAFELVLGSKKSVPWVVRESQTRSAKIIPWC